MNHPSNWMKRLSQPSKVASILDWKKTTNTVLAINFHKNRVGIAVASHPSRGVPCFELEPLRFDTVDGSGGEMNHRRRRRKTIAGAIDRECLERFSKIVEEHKVCGVVVNWPIQRETGRMGAACGRVIFALEQLGARSIESPSSSSSSSSVEAERQTDARADTGHKTTRAPGEGSSEQQDRSLLSRPFCLWDARRIDQGHPRKRVDAFGRCVSYGKNQEPQPTSDSAPAPKRLLSETTPPFFCSNVNNYYNTPSKSTATGTIDRYFHDERDYFAGREQYHEDEHTVVLGVWEDFCREHWPDLWRSAVATTTVWSSDTSTAAGRRSPHRGSTRLSRAMAADLRATETKTKKKKSLVAMR